MATLVELRGVVKHFPVSRSLGEIVRGAHPVVRALEGVSFDIGAGDAIAIVGESGCGKTTLGRLMLKLAEPTAGSIAFDGAPLDGLSGDNLRAFRRQAPGQVRRVAGTHGPRPRVQRQPPRRPRPLRGRRKVLPSNESSNYGESRRGRRD